MATASGSQEGEHSSHEKILQLKITLKDIQPPIWRRILVSSEDTFGDLHSYIQAAMGWGCCHLHVFESRSVRIVDSEADPNDFMFCSDDIFKEDETKLSQFFSAPKNTMTYTYDFGDNWRHKIVLEKILPPEPNTHYPKYVAGKRACPPEDCGGVGGYQHLLEVRANPGHKEYEDLITNWLEDLYPGYDPEKIDVTQFLF